MLKQIRVEVTESNIKLLQVLDILECFEIYSEIPLEKSRSKIQRYLSDLSLEKEDIELIVSKYPMKSQINFYKLGVLNEITSKRRGF